MFIDFVETCKVCKTRLPCLTHSFTGPYIACGISGANSIHQSQILQKNNHLRLDKTRMYTKTHLACMHTCNYIHIFKKISSTIC